MATIGGFPQKNVSNFQTKPAPLLSPNPPSKYGVDGLSDLGYPLDLGLMKPAHHSKPPSKAESSWSVSSSKLVAQAVGYLGAAASFVGTAGLALGVAGLAAHLSNRKHS